MTSKHISLSRRQFLQFSGVVAGAGLLAACVAPTAQQGEAGGAAPTSDKASVVVWYQDWDGANRIMDKAKKDRAETDPNITIELTPIGYGDLFAKMLPAIASGTEGDVLMMYTNWVVGTDVTKVFLELTDVAGGAKSLEETMWTSAFTALDVPAGKVFYFPWLAGIRGAVLTVNKDQLAEKKIDYLNFKTYEEVIEAGKALTEKNSDGKITRSGYSIRNSQWTVLPSLIWQMGGEFFDRESGKWSFSSDIGEQAAQMLYDIYWKDQTCDFDLFQTEFEAVSQKLVSIWGDGAWTCSVQTDSAQLNADNIVTPLLANKVKDVLYPDHIAGWGLSKRLADAGGKLDAAVDFAKFIVSPDSLIAAFDSYSGVCMTKTVYQDPRIEKMKYGLISKRVAEGVWPIARFTGDHVANHDPSHAEFDRAMRKEITVKEALANMDAYLQDQEDQSRERINSGG